MHGVTIWLTSIESRGTDSIQDHSLRQLPDEGKDGPALSGQRYGQSSVVGVSNPNPVFAILYEDDYDSVQINPTNLGSATFWICNGLWYWHT